MIRIVTKQEYYCFDSSLKKLPFSNTDISIIVIFNQFIDDYEDDEIDVYGFFDNSQELQGLIRYSEEALNYLFEEFDIVDNRLITLIGALIVHPKHRGKGLAKELVTFTVNDVKTEVVVADPFDIQSGRFFHSIDFSFENAFGDTGEWLLYKKK
ncbi:GNAT family N-acetyltransferase [Peribacillus simplex]|uniref:GNAT family N-acetyltransferase n=1 Tax=Peribacillus simplex TaxID=1478 RepID=UPI00366BD1B1